MVVWVLKVGTNPRLQFSGSLQSSVGPGPPTINDSESSMTFIAVVAVAVALMSPSESCSVAAIVSLKHPSNSAGGVIVRLDRFQLATSCEVSSAVAVKLWPAPSLSVAPPGIQLTTSGSGLFGVASPLAPDRLLAITPRSRAIAVPSLQWGAPG